MAYTGKYYINTLDVAKQWGIIFEKGTFNELLKFPARRDEYSQVWKDEDGTQRYTDDVFFDTRELSLSIVIVGTDENDFKTKLKSFRDYLMQSGYFTFDCVELDMRFTLLYKDMQSVTMMTKIKGMEKVAARFKLTLQDDYPSQILNIPGSEYGGYGVEWDEDNADPALTRVAGTMSLHASLPVQSLMKRCLVKDDGTVNYYLDASDSTKKADGSASVLDGTDGQVMVEIPAHYIHFEIDGDTRRAVVSLNKMPAAKYVPKRYIGAYEAALNRTQNKLASVVNTTAAYRGGNNQSGNDADAGKTLLGRPVTAKSRNDFNTFATSRGANWSQYTYEAHKSIFWLFMIEYANRNCQAAVDNTLTTDGYRKGGLGTGVTAIATADWTTFNGVYPFVPCGATNSLGNNTGEIAFTVVGWPGGDMVVKVPSYRGIENPFGHIWKWMDGANIRIQADAAGGLSEVYVFDNPSDYNGKNYTNGRKVGNLPRSVGYVTSLLFGAGGEMLPADDPSAGSSTTYWCDYFYTAIPASGEELRGLIVGGHASAGAAAGVGYVHSTNVPSYTSSNIGSRLCYLAEGR